MTEVQRSEGLNIYQPEASQSALKLRLNSKETLEIIEMYLNGEEYRYDENNRLIKVEIPAVRKANQKGVRAIMSIVSGYVNPDAVQGNLTAEEIGALMYLFKKDMGNLLSFYPEELGIDRSDRTSIRSFIEPFVRMFISRTKDNKERDSYGMKTIETGRIVNEGGLSSFNPFSKKN